MAGFKIPVFAKGTILTHEMLEALKNYEVDLGVLSYEGYSNGIISGCEVSMSGNLLYVNRGILIFDGNLYFLSKELKVMANSGTEWQILQFRMGNISRDKNFLIGEMQLELSSDLNEYPNKIEICRFRLQNGSTLRNQYRDFADINTEFDTVNEIYAKWAGYNNETISNRILKEFAKEAIKKRSWDSQDIMFIQQILALDGRTLNREAIIFYLSVRLKRPYKEMTNIEIYRGLKEVLALRHTADVNNTSSQRTVRRLIVD